MTRGRRPNPENIYPGFGGFDLAVDQGWRIRMHPLSSALQDPGQAQDNAAREEIPSTADTMTSNATGPPQEAHPAPPTQRHDPSSERRAAIDEDHRMDTSSDTESPNDSDTETGSDTDGDGSGSQAGDHVDPVQDADSETVDLAAQAGQMAEDSSTSEHADRSSSQAATSNMQPQRREYLVIVSALSSPVPAFNHYTPYPLPHLALVDPAAFQHSPDGLSLTEAVVRPARITPIAALTTLNTDSFLVNEPSDGPLPVFSPADNSVTTNALVTRARRLPSYNISAFFPYADNPHRQDIPMSEEVNDNDRTSDPGVGVRPSDIGVDLEFGADAIGNALANVEAAIWSNDQITLIVNAMLHADEQSMDEGELGQEFANAAAADMFYNPLEDMWLDLNMSMTALDTDLQVLHDDEH